jgi:hypothetical protein
MPQLIFHAKDRDSVQNKRLRAWKRSARTCALIASPLIKADPHLHGIQPLAEALGRKRIDTATIL